MTFSAIVFAVSCTTDFGADIKAMEQKLAQTEDNLAALGQITANLGGLRNLLAIAQSGDPIESASPIQDGYAFAFKNNGSVSVHNQTAGISVTDIDGEYYWTLNGALVKDASGKNVPISVSPEFRVADGAMEVSFDVKKSWTPIEFSEDPVITKVEEDASEIHLTLLGNVPVNLAKEKLMKVAFSGDGSTLDSQGKVVVDYYITGGVAPYMLATSQPLGWSPQTFEENDSKGQIVFTASGNPASGEVNIYVKDASGYMTVTTLNLASLIPDETFPLMALTYDAYNIACEGGSVDVTVSTNLEYEITIDSDAAAWLTLTGTKAIREDKLTFSAPANDAIEMRLAKITLTAEDYFKVFYVCQDGRRPAVGQNLSENGTANCYIVPEEGDYYFDATVIGNGQDGIIADAGFHTDNAAINPAMADILWEFTSEPVVEDIRLEDGKVYFHATGKKGNVTVCVMDEDETVLWSWHIWCTDIPKEKTHTIDDGQQFTLLDRNLGATSSNPEDGEATYGLYYQWGRKDPFAGEEMREWMASNIELTVGYSVQRPIRALKTNKEYSYNWIADDNHYLWGNPETQTSKPVKDLVKSIYDPCPPGYLVPPASASVILRDSSRLEFITNGFILSGDYGQTSFYPYAGRVYQSSWDAYGHNPDELSAALWNSCAAIYNLGKYDGGSCTYYSVNKLSMSLNYGDFRARGIPVRCLKQVR